jgi:hypothetical protein
MRDKSNYPLICIIMSKHSADRAAINSRRPLAQHDQAQAARRIAKPENEFVIA